MEQTHKKLHVLVIYLVLTLVTIVAFEQVRLCEFTSTDDMKFAAQNSHVQAGLTRKSIAWAFTTTTTANWIPLTWLSVMLDSQIFGHSSTTFHLMNLFYHVLNVLLLFMILRKMTGTIWPSAFVAAVFALHPLRVESVAWIAERKDVLSGLFWMLTITAYVRYTQQPCIRRYLLVFLFLCLGLLAKPMLVTLPCVLLLLDYWPLGRVQWNSQNVADQLQYDQSTHFTCKKISPECLIAEKIPLSILSVASCITTVIAQQAEGAVKSMDRFALSVRFNNALVSYVSYIGKMIWPTRLAHLYPHPGRNLLISKAVIALVILVSVSAAVIYMARRRHNLAPLLVGWLWYLGTLVPVIGLVQVGGQSMANRYTYLPSIGILIMVAWGAERLSDSWRHRKMVFAISTGLLLISLTLCTRAQVKHWKNSLTLFGHDVKATPNNYLVHYHYGNALFQDGRLDEAAFHYQTALQINPRHLKSYNRLAYSLYMQGKFDETISVCKKRLRVSKPGPVVYHRLGQAYASKGDGILAIQSFKESLRLEPDSVSTHKNLARLAMGLTNYDVAISLLAEAIQLNPNIALTHFNLARALRSKGRTEEAITHFSQALRIKPDWEKPMNALAWILATHSQERFRNPTEAIRLAQRTWELSDYQDSRSADTLAAAYAAAGRFEDAVATAEKAVQIAASGNNKKRTQKIRERLELYKTGQAYFGPLFVQEKNGP
jgi:tetratricopeptide (TPR) repeat protein